MANSKNFNYKKTENEIAKKEFGKDYSQLSNDDKMVCDMFVHDLASEHFLNI